MEYWECVKCDTLFSDANASSEIEDVSIPASHELVLVEEAMPTCSASGHSEYWECASCDKVFSDKNGKTETEPIFLAGGHSFSSGVCARCGANGTPELIYEKNGESYTVMGVSDTSLSQIVIPALYEGLPVTNIGEGAFVECKNLVSLEVGANVCAVGGALISEGKMLPELINRTMYDLSAVFPSVLCELRSGDSLIRNVNGFMFLAVDGDVTLLGYTGDKTTLTLPEEFLLDETTRLILPSMILASDFESTILIPFLEKIAIVLELYLSESNPDVNFSFMSNEKYVQYEYGVISSRWVRKYTVEMEEIIRDTFRSDDEIRYLLEEVINLLRKLTSAYVCKNPTQYIGNDRYTEYLENMYEIYPITREGKAIYVYSYYDIYYNKLEISSIITSMLPEYTYDVMVSQEKAAGVEKSNGYYITSFIGGDKVTDITVSDGVSFIANGAFSDAVSLQSINVGNGVTTIATSAFLGCTSLRTVYIGENVSTINYKAFSGCTALESVTFADTEGWQYNVTDPAINAQNLKETYCLESWYKDVE